MKDFSPAHMISTSRHDVGQSVLDGRYSKFQSLGHLVVSFSRPDEYKWTVTTFLQCASHHTDHTLVTLIKSPVFV